MIDTGAFGGPNRYYDRPEEMAAARKFWPSRGSEAEVMIRTSSLSPKRI